MPVNKLDFIEIIESPTFILQSYVLFCSGSVFFSSKDLSGLFIDWEGFAWSALGNPDSTNHSGSVPNTELGPVCPYPLLSSILELAESS